MFEGDKATFVSHISSGDNSEWCEEVTISPGEIGNEDGTEPLKRGECGKSITPGGVYQYKRRVIGRRESALGGMLNPVYFNYGIAVHGAINVPLQPASHGCIRIPNDMSEGFAGLVEIGDLVYVWDGVKEPEIYGQVVPPFNTRRSRLLDDHHDDHDHQHDDHHHGGADHRAVGHHHRARDHHDRRRPTTTSTTTTTHDPRCPSPDAIEV